jgi:hypothetical protein
VRWDIFPMFGKPSIGRQPAVSGQCGVRLRTSDCESFRCIAKPTIAGAAPRERLPLAGRLRRYRKNQWLRGPDLNVRNLASLRERNPRAPLAPIIQRTQSYKDRALASKSVVWCPGRESYAITDMTNRCLFLVWWRERLAQWRRSSRNPQRGRAPLGGQLGSLGSILMACRNPPLIRTLDSNPALATLDSCD